MVNAPAGNQTRVSSVAGTYTITVLPAHKIFAPRLELGISRVLGERHNQLDHANIGNGVSGFRSQYLVLAKDARFRLRQYPDTTPRGFEPLRSKTTHLAGEPLNHSGKVSFCLSTLGWPTLLSVYRLEKHKNTNTHSMFGNLPPGRLRDRQK